jgi:hypothetical protein
MSLWLGSGHAITRSGEEIVRRIAVIFILPIAVLALGLALPAAARADDTSPPQVTSFRISPAVIDTESAPQTVVITMTLTDDQSGVALYTDPDIQFGKICSGLLMPWDGREFSSASRLTVYPERIEGTPLDAVYRATVTFPVGVMRGAWKIAHLTLSDKVGNEITLRADDIEALCGDGCATVTNTAATADTTPPQITAFSLEPSTVDTQEGPATVAATMTLTDDQSGVATSGDLEAHTYSLSSLSLAPLTGTQSAVDGLKRVAGTYRDGVFTATFTLPEGSQSGIWRAHLHLADRAGNEIDLLASDLDLRFGAGCAHVNNAALAGDTTPPRVESLSIAPPELNAETGDQRLTITMRVTDDLSGVNDAYNADGKERVEVRLRPLTSTQVVTVWPRRVSGDMHDGTYSAKATIPDDAAAGVWQVDTVVLIDRMGNVSVLFTDDLRAGVPGADLSFVLQWDSLPPVATATGIAEGWTKNNQTLTLSAVDVAQAGVDPSGVAAIQYSLDGGVSWKPYEAPLPFWLQGDTVVMYRASDRRGNTSAAAAVNVRIDTSAPTTVVTGVPAGWSSAVSVTLTAEDALSGVATTEYRILGADAWTPYTGPFQPCQGASTYEYRSIDAAGNIEATQTVDVKYDTGRPVPIALADQIAIPGGTVALPFRVNDVSLSVTVTIRIYKGDRLKRTIFVGSVTSNKDLRYRYRCTLSPGAYTWKVSATDLTGHREVTPSARTLVVKKRWATASKHAPRPWLYSNPWK